MVRSVKPSLSGWYFDERRFSHQRNHIAGSPADRQHFGHDQFIWFEEAARVCVSPFRCHSATHGFSSLVSEGYELDVSRKQIHNNQDHNAALRRCCSVGRRASVFRSRHLFRPALYGGRVLCVSLWRSRQSCWRLAQCRHLVWRHFAGCLWLGRFGVGIIRYASRYSRYSSDPLLYARKYLRVGMNLCSILYLLNYQIDQCTDWEPL